MMQQEHEIQKALFNWLNVCGIAECKLAFAIPNGGLRNIKVARKLKAEGVRSGVPDIFIPVARNGYHGLFLELKTEKGRVTPHQKEWLEALNNQGFKAVVAYGFDDAVEIIKGYLSD